MQSLYKQLERKTVTIYYINKFKTKARTLVDLDTIDNVSEVYEDVSKFMKMKNFIYLLSIYCKGVYNRA